MLALHATSAQHKWDFGVEQQERDTEQRAFVDEKRGFGTTDAERVGRQRDRGVTLANLITSQRSVIAGQPTSSQVQRDRSARRREPDAGQQKADAVKREADALQRGPDAVRRDPSAVQPDST